MLRSDLRGVYGVRRQSWNLGINRGSVIPMPTAATTSTYCMGSSCPWALRRVLAVEIKLDGAGYVAGGVNTGQGAASKSGSRLEVSARRASACPPHSMPSRTGNDGGPCVHCAADWASLWRENANGDDVCKLAGCWRLEEWLPPLVRNLKRSRAQGGSSASDAEPVQVVQHAVTLKKITDIYGHRCRLRWMKHAPAHHSSSDSHVWQVL